MDHFRMEQIAKIIFKLRIGLAVKLFNSVNRESYHLLQASSRDVDHYSGRPLKYRKFKDKIWGVIVILLLFSSGTSDKSRIQQCLCKGINIVEQGIKSLQHCYYEYISRNVLPDYHSGRPSCTSTCLVVDTHNSCNPRFNLI